jgi:hypothetical protein
LFLGDSEAVSDIGAALALADDGSVRYRSYGRPLAAPDGSGFAVEAFRAADEGVDLLILDADGALVETIGTPVRARPAAQATATTVASATRTPSATVSSTATLTATVATTVTGTATAVVTPTITPIPTTLPLAATGSVTPYWSRPLAWSDDGALYYLTTICASSLVQEYQLYRWAGPRRSELVATGQTSGALGDVTALGNGIAYVTSAQARIGTRGGQNVDLRSPAELWFWDVSSGVRGTLLTAERGIGALSR